MEIYSNVCEFIRFSGLSEDYVPLDEKKLATAVNSLDPIDIDLPSVFIRIYTPNCKRSVKIKILSFIETCTKKTILIKQKWSFQSDKAILFAYSVFEHNIAEIYKPHCPKIEREKVIVTSLNSRNELVEEEIEAIFAFHRIQKKGLPTIKPNDVLASWLLAEIGDVISYIIVTNKGPYFAVRIVQWDSSNEPLSTPIDISNTTTD